MISAHPSSGDLFYLRILLKHRAGATSFEDLRTINGAVHQDFKSACIALELCEDDSQWITCLNEAVEISHAYSICCLFCNIVLHCHPTQPDKLFSQFKDAMSDDFLYKRRNILNISDDRKRLLSYNDLLFAINDLFSQQRKSNADFGIDMPDDELASSKNAIETATEFDPNAEAFYNDNIGKLNEDQDEVFNAIADSVNNKKGELFKLDAPGGCGKTHVSKFTLCYVRKNGRIAIACAISGIAAILLPLGTTFHRRFGVPIPCYMDSSSNIKLESKEANIIRQAELIMIMRCQ